MPCSAPCDRLPCSKRCINFLPCGHQCPSICGEDCPKDYCQTCCSVSKRDQRVDLLEFKSYSEISIDETPIVVLSCGHFFTAETLDGHMEMAEVYVQDSGGEFLSLQENLGTLARGVPKCPDCQRPVRQYATQRYNRAINRAVIDEMSKKFLVSGKAKIQDFEREINQLEDGFEQSKNEFLPPSFIGLSRQLGARYEMSEKLMKNIVNFLQLINDKHQPARKLFDATVKSIEDSEAVDRQLKRLTIQGSIVVTPRDHTIIFGGRAIQLKALYTVFVDRADLYQALKPTLNEAFPKSYETDLMRSSKNFFESCSKFISDCNSENVPKLNVEARLYFGRAARVYHVSFPDLRTTAEAREVAASAREYLNEAKNLCAQPFPNADKFLIAAEKISKSLQMEWYEPISAEEMASIKNAMVSGSAGIMAHSGHWYNCQNGHPVSLACSSELFAEC